MVKAIAASVSIPIEIGGGIRSEEIIADYLSAGVKRFIIGTAALEDFSQFKKMIEQFGDSIIAGVDAKSAKVATRGWKNVSGVSAVAFIKELVSAGIHEIIYTDIATDGMLKGPNIDGIKEILAHIKGIRLIASGGVGSISDIRRLKELEPLGVIGCIVGKAIYDGRIDLTEAITIE